MEVKGLQPIKILMIEDDTAYVQLVRLTLSKENNSAYILESYDNVSQGIQRVAEGHFDVILLDLDLIDSRGIETFYRVRGSVPKIPIVILTSTKDEAIAHKAIYGGAQDYWAKDELSALAISRVIRHAILRRQTEENLESREKYYRLLVENVSDVITVLDHDGFIRFDNPSVERILGYRQGDLVGKNVYDYIYPEDHVKVKDALKKARADVGKAELMEFRFRNSDGVWRILEASGIYIAGGAWDDFIVVNSRDITDRKKAEEMLRMLSLTDELTGLNNRRGFMFLAEQQHEMFCRTKRGFLIFIIDLDHLKQINDTLGHDAGDQALKESAYIFTQTFRKPDVIARIGGDEFAVIASDAIKDNIPVILNRMEDHLKKLNSGQGRSYQLSLSAGVACFEPAQPLTVEQLMNEADKEMYARKAEKRKQGFNTVINQKKK